MKNEVCVFNGNEVSFVLDKENNMMVNATQLAKVYDKDLHQFTKSDHAQAFISSCLKPANAGLLGLKSEEDLIVSRQKSGTWMNRVLALKFAAWLNPDLEVWVYSTIESLLFGRHVKREQSFEKTIALQKEMDDLREKPDKNGDDFERYLQIQYALKREVAVRKSLTVEGLCGMKSLF